MPEALDDAPREEERAGRRALLDERMYAGALQDLAAVVETPESFDPRGWEGFDDALSRACAAVARAEGIALSPPPAIPESLPLRHRVEAVCAASRVRHRRVALRGDWWKTDCGALLAFRGRPDAKDNALEPVAVLPLGPGRYELLEPAAGARMPLDGAAAAALHPFAYALYRPFGDGKVGLRGLLAFFGRDMARDVAMAAALGVLGALLGMAIPMATGKIFDVVVPSADRAGLAHFTLGLIAAAAASAAFSFTQAIALLRVEGKWGGCVQAAVWDRLLRLPAPFFREYTVGDLAMRANAVNSMRELISGSVLASTVASLQGGFNLFLLFHYHSQLALVACLVLAAVAAFQIAVMWLSLRKRYALTELEGKLGGLVLQLLNGISKLRVSAAEPRAFAVWSRRYAESCQAAFSAERLGAYASVFNGFIPVLSTMVLYYVVDANLHPGASNPGAAPISVGDFIAFSAAFSTFLSAGTSLSATALQLAAVGPLWSRARPILEAVPEDDGSKAHPGLLQGRIDVRHASFRYRADGPRVLDDVSFHVEPGQFVAVVGPSGSGKSSLMRLLLGFEKPELGAVYYDGKDLAKHDVTAIRRQIGAVLQNARLIAGDVYTNIVGGLPLSMEEAWAAAEAAGLADDIRGMPMGMQTIIGEGASTLSGGQRQRLIIARALARKPRIILFDEATSALDNRTQAIVTESLSKLKVTRLVIAHRLSTIRDADRILVIDRGALKEAGTYDELMARKGLFFELACRQTA